MSSSSSSSPEVPVPSVRGRKARSTRGRGRGGRGGARARGARTERADIALNIVQTRKERMKEKIAGMGEERMRDVLLQLVEVQPSLIMDILEPVERQPGGHHPDNDSPYPDWCVCLNCREMPTERERVCCEMTPVDCLSLLPDFQVLILDEAVLALARLYRQDVLVFEEGADVRKANRHAAYRQFVLWSFGRLGQGNRVVIPSCCVWMIRDRYPDPFGQYTGFIATRLA